MTQGHDESEEMATTGMQSTRHRLAGTWSRPSVDRVGPSGRRWRRRGAAIVATVVVLGAGYAAHAATAGPTLEGYRVATASVGSVTASLTLTGTVQRVSQLTAAFPVSGSVSGVLVKVGDTVTPGQQLATLDPAPLQAAVTDAQAQLLQAQAQLAADEASPAGTSASPPAGTSAPAAAPPSGAARSAPATPTAPSSAGSKGMAAVATPDPKPMQQAVAAMDAAAKSESTACAPVLAATPVQQHPTGSATSAPTSPPTTPPTHPPNPSTGGGTANDVSPQQVAGCVAALKAWSSALSGAQNAVTAYTAALANSQQSGPAASAARSAPSAARPGMSGSASGSSGAARSSHSPAAQPSQPSQASQASQQARVLGDEAAVTAAQQALTQAQANLAGATLTAPMGGVVGSVGLVPGQPETPAAGITIVGPGAVTVTVPVPLDQVRSVKAGQVATVSPPGLGALAGSVSQVGLLPASPSSATPVYDVTVAVPDAPVTLATGTYALTTITTATVSNVLTVPVSALAGAASGVGRVTVVKDGVPTPTRVTLGAVGGGFAEIRSGLSAGDTVVLADVHAPLPTNSTPNLRGLTGPAGPRRGPAPGTTGTGTPRAGGRGAS